MDELIGLFGVSEEDGNEHSYEAQLMTDACQRQLQPEVEEGNVEFKLKLVNPSKSRMEHLITQMKWRLREGHGEAIYQIGVEDRGAVLGLCRDELEASLANLKKMADRLNADISILREVVVDPVVDKKAVEVLVRKILPDKPFVDMRVCVLGNADCGKSTFVGVMTSRELDSGRGRARLNLFRHPHEMQTGRTTSVCLEILGFDSHGNIIDYSVARNKEELSESSSKLVTFIDLPGSPKGQKTTIFGMTGYHPDICLVLVAANQGITDMTQEHFLLALALKIPCAIVVTKSDMLDEQHVGQLESGINFLLQFAVNSKTAVSVKSNDDVIYAANNFYTKRLIPVFVTSCVTGDGMDLIKQFLHLLPKNGEANSPSGNNSPTHHQNVTSQSGTDGCHVMKSSSSAANSYLLNGDSDAMHGSEVEAVFKIFQDFSVPNVGCVVGGILRRGIIKQGDELSLGPFDDGSFKKVQVKSLHRSGRTPCSTVRCNESAAIALKPSYNQVRKGMVLLACKSMTSVKCENNPMTVTRMPSQSGNFKAAEKLQAQVEILQDRTKIAEGLKCTLHVDNIVQTAVVEKIVKSNQQQRTKANSVGGASTENIFEAAVTGQLGPADVVAESENRRKHRDRALSESQTPLLKKDDVATITFHFQRRCEYVQPGMRLLFRLGKSKGIGKIVKVFPYNPS